MDIIKELELVKNSDGELKNVLKYIREERELWNKKLYIFKIIEVADDIESLIKEGVFKDHSIEHILIYHDAGGEIDFSFHNEAKSKINPTVALRYFSPYKTLSTIFARERELYQQYITENIKVFIDLKENIQEQVVNALLPEELKTILKYSEMNLEIPNKEESVTKRPKI
jgi:hypothetical protein